MTLSWVRVSVVRISVAVAAFLAGGAVNVVCPQPPSAATPSVSCRPLDSPGPMRRLTIQLEASLDGAAHPNPGRTDTFRRLNRTEYQNAIRDLLALDVDVSGMLPTDEAGHGFDNVTFGNLSPTLLEQYLQAALKVSRLAPLDIPGTVRIRTIDNRCQVY